VEGDAFLEVRLRGEGSKGMVWHPLRFVADLRCLARAGTNRLR
jgi:hypothetical protein